MTFLSLDRAGNSELKAEKIGNLPSVGIQPHNLNPMIPHERNKE